MEAHVEEVRKLEELFDGLQKEHIPLAENSIADHLSKCAAQKLPVEPRTFVLHLTQPSVSPTAMARKRRKLDSGKYHPPELPKAPGREVARKNSTSPGEQHPPAELQLLAVEICAPTNEEVPFVLVAEPQAPTRARHIVHYLQTGELPEEQEDIERVARRSSMYQFVDDMLYRRRSNSVKLKCISREEGKELLAEIHKGACGSHIGSRALVGKAFQQGFYWPMALQDAIKLVTRCEACQFHSKNIHQPAQAL
ncbi:uncharacterized protein [Aegilops tauschii subsp. strangulata]|uniref:uncharacterized protein n=1 Tax=Aegilops tauschii subsp. strangulata TaxID=200361 RepID=UPI00098B645B|nr:uncharacterized protein LOC109758811 [Aegilops tauschii subsp. strangulata]